MFSSAEKSTQVSRQQSTAGATFFRKAGEESFFHNNKQTSFFSAPVQAKLSVSSPDDPQEKEADAVADKVMRVSEPAAISAPGNKEEEKLQKQEEKEQEPMQAKAEIPAIQREEKKEEVQAQSEPTQADMIQRMEEKKEEVHAKREMPVITTLQRSEDKKELQAKSYKSISRKENDNTNADAVSSADTGSVIQLDRKKSSLYHSDIIQRSGRGPPENHIPFEQSLSSSKGGGSALPDNTKQFMESRFNADFSGVKIHTGSAAENMNRSINAQAFAHGNDIYFNSGKYSPNTADGGSLLAHELTHTLQQGASNIIQKHPVASRPTVRQNRTALFGLGSVTGMILEDFESYTRTQADWFAEPTLLAADRTFLWNVLMRIRSAGHLLTSVGDIQLAALALLSAAEWDNLTAFSRGGSRTDTVIILLPRTYSLTNRLQLGETLLQLEAIIRDKRSLNISVSETQLNDLRIGGTTFMSQLRLYWILFNPIIQRNYSPGAGARDLEFENVLNLMRGPGLVTFITLLGQIRNLHRFTIPTLNRLVTNFADFSRTKPVHLVLHTGHDDGAFQDSAPLFQDLVINSPNLVLIVEGRATLASITSMIPDIALTYGQPDSSGTYRIGQVMIAGHGQTRTVQLAGTGSVIDSLDLDTNFAATQTLIDTLLRNMDSATASVVFAGCLVGSNHLPLGMAPGSMTAHIASTPSLATFVEQRAATQGMSGTRVEGARASLGLSSSSSLFDRTTGDLHIINTLDPTAFGNALTYVATGNEPEGLLRAAVEVGLTSTITAESQLRIRASRTTPATDPRWSECTLVFVNLSLSAISPPGSGIDIDRINLLANIAEIPFLTMFDKGVSVAHWVSVVNVHSSIANDIYSGMVSTPTFISTPNLTAQKGRFILEQGWIALGAARGTDLISFLDAHSAMTSNILMNYLDSSALSGHSSSLFMVPAVAGAASAPATVSGGRIRLALAWIMQDPTNADVRSFLNTQVTGTSTPGLSAAATLELGGISAIDVLTALGRLTPTTTTAAGTTLENANADTNANNVNDVRIVPNSYTATVLPYALNVRTGPSMRRNPFHWLRRGENVQVAGFVHEWAAIDINGHLGFVFNLFISPPPP